MTKILLRTPDDRVLFFLRVVLGVVMFAHGTQKVFGWFGGYGFEGTMGFFTGQLGIPALFAFLAIAAEFAGGLGLIVGLFTRVAALGVLSVMLVATWMIHRSIGFFMNWYGQLPAGQEGFEYHLLVAGIATVLLVRGGGWLSADRWLTRAAA
jgi:putative oxidoreductase